MNMPDTALIIPWVVNTAMWCGYSFMLLATWCASLFALLCVAEWTIRKCRFIDEFLRFVVHRARQRNAREESK